MNAVTFPRVQRHRLMSVLTLTAATLSLLSGPTLAADSERYHPPLQVAIMPDNSLSTLDNGIPRVTPTDIEPLLQYLSTWGGELALNAVQARSQVPLVRLFIVPPPERPVDSSTLGTNVFLVGPARSRFVARLSVFDSCMAAWRAQAVAKIDTARSRFTAFLSGSATDSASDIYYAVRRVDTYLAESGAAWTVAPMKFALLCTDGEQTASRDTMVPFRSGAEVIVVPGEHLGILAPLHPLTFENVPAAVRYIVATAEHNTNSSPTRK